MRFSKLVLLTLLFSSFAAHGAPETKEAVVPPAVELPKDQPCLLFILGGQSNMDGCGKPNELPEPYRKHPDNVVTWDNKRKCWVKLAQDSTAIARNFQFGPEIAFAHELATTYPDKTIAVMKTSAGGTRLFTQWVPEGGMYQRFIANMNNATAQLKADGIPLTLSGMLWMQGESDSDNLDHAKAYDTNITRMFADVRKQTGNPILPIVMGRISSSLLKKTPWNFDHCRIVQAAQDRITEADPHVHIVHTDEFSTLKDNTHFDSKAQITLGKQMADLMIKELKEAKP